MSHIALMTAEEREQAKAKAKATRAAKKFAVDPAEVTFGVEIECYIPNDSIFDFRVNVANYHDGGGHLGQPFPQGWRAESDGSLTSRLVVGLGDPPAGMKALEFISPPLKGLEGIEEVRKVIEFIGNPRSEGGLGGRVTKRCGQHVHIGMRSVMGARKYEFNAVSEWVRRLLHLIAKHETALCAITGSPERIGNEYCASVKDDWKGRAGKHMSWDTLTGHNNTVDRRHTLNVKNLFTDKKTVEFRVFEGTLTPVKTLGYIFVAIGLAIKAAEETAVAEWDDKSTFKTAEAQYYVAAVKHLHDRLAWMDAASRRKHGFMPGAWELYGKRVKENQLWNAKHLAAKVATRY